MASKKSEYPRVEIAQMAFVFGQVKEPDEDVVQYIEDIVHAQVSEIVVQARAQSARRGARVLSVEDLIFMIRHDRPKVNRLRTYLSWKDVRKKVKESDHQDEAPEIETIEEPSTVGLKARKLKIKIPWEVTTIFSEHLGDDSDEEDEDEIEAYEDSKKRLKEADELTKGMTREQYHYYADCRQASFTYRKGKRFREFVNIGAYVEGVTNDEVMDVIGFLCYEMVRALCESGTHTKSTVAAARAVAAINSIKEERAKEVEKARKAKGKGKAMEVEEVVGGQEVSSPAAATTDDKGSNKRSRKGEAVPTPKSPPRRLVDPISLFSEPLNEAPPSGWNTPGGQLVVATGGDQRSVTLPATPGGNTLDVQDVHGGYVGMQRDQSALKASGMRNWRGGLKRVRMGFI